ncbi:uncharacterized protein [Watersipora subatra]|uniref:uncharacterized protein n=1 Tax=Watersipora subatra TaxID=2589382 RepID=UPI00355C80B8
MALPLFINLLSVFILGAVLQNADFTSAGPVNSCPALENCMTFVEGPCDASGRRTVCLEWVETTRRNSCTLNPEFNRIDHLCIVGDQSSTIRNVGPGVPVCTSNVPSGSTISFAMSDGDQLPNGPNPRVLNLPKTAIRANCTGYHSRVCDSFGDNDILLTFNTSPCESCTPVFLPPSKISGNGCFCQPRGVINGCSVSCGRGTQTAVYDCRGTCGEISQQIEIPCRCGSCAGLFDGEWSDWGPYDDCAINCDTNRVQRERSRTCEGQRRVAGGRNCEGFSREVETCNSLVFSGACRRRTTPVPLVQNSPPQSPGRQAQPSQRGDAPRSAVPRTGVIARGPMDSCDKISKCFKYYMTECDEENKRYTCFYWDEGPECGLPSNYQVERVCREHNFTSSRSLGMGETLICYMATAGWPLSFGVDDGPRNSGTDSPSRDPQTYMFRGNGTPLLAACSGYTSLCAFSGGNDIRVTFDIPPCP